MTEPLYRVVYETLINRIHSGEYTSGAALPSEPKLAREFGVSLITIRRAIHELVLDGLVETRQGIGNFVRDAAGNVVVVGISTFTTDVAAGRLRLARTLMEDTLVRATAKVAEKLGVHRGSMLRYLVRLDSEGGVPLSVDEVYIPPVIASSITPEDAASPLFLQLWLERAGLELKQVDFEISVEAPGAREQEMLQVGKDVPLLVTGELVIDSSGKPVSWFVTRYRGDRCRLSGSWMLVQK